MQTIVTHNNFRHCRDHFYVFARQPCMILGTLSNRRRRPDDGNRKRDISFETSLRMYKTLWPDVAQSRSQSLIPFDQR